MDVRRRSRSKRRHHAKKKQRVGTQLGMSVAHTQGGQRGHGVRCDGQAFKT